VKCKINGFPCKPVDPEEHRHNILNSFNSSIQLAASGQSITPEPVSISISEGSRSA
jgi:hypothetical protein